MKTLKQYIKESILDDEDIIYDKTEKLLKNPFGYFFRLTNENSNWSNNVKKFEDIIKPEASKDLLNISNYGPGIQEKIKTGDVYVWICNHLKEERIVILFSKSDLQPMKDAKLIAERFINITLAPNRQKNNRALISVSSGLPGPALIKRRYKLSREHSQCAIDMINLLVKGGWRNFWENL